MNTYHLNPELRKITSPVRVVIGDQEQSFRDGQELVSYSFERNYRVEKIYAEGDRIVVELIEHSSTPTCIGAGEEQTSFF